MFDRDLADAYERCYNEAQPGFESAISVTSDTVIMHRNAMRYLAIPLRRCYDQAYRSVYGAYKEYGYE